MKAVLPESIVSRAKSPSSVNLNGELVMMDLETEKYLGLNPVASRIWEATETPCSVNSICSLLQKEYAVDESTCENDVCACVEKMRSLGLVDVS